MTTLALNLASRYFAACAVLEEPPWYAGMRVKWGRAYARILCTNAPFSNTKHNEFHGVAAAVWEHDYEFVWLLTGDPQAEPDFEDAATLGCLTDLMVRVWHKRQAATLIVKHLDCDGVAEQPEDNAPYIRIRIEGDPPTVQPLYFEEDTVVEALIASLEEAARMDKAQKARNP